MRLLLSVARHILLYIVGVSSACGGDGLRRFFRVQTPRSVQRSIGDEVADRPLKVAQYHEERCYSYRIPNQHNLANMHK